MPEHFMTATCPACGAKRKHAILGRVQPQLWPLHCCAYCGAYFLPLGVGESQSSDPTGKSREAEVTDKLIDILGQAIERLTSYRNCV